MAGREVASQVRWRTRTFRASVWEYGCPHGDAEEAVGFPKDYAFARLVKSKGNSERQSVRRRECIFDK